MTGALAGNVAVEPTTADGAASLVRSLFAKADPDLSDDALRHLELRHRTKNMLAIVQSLVNQTLQGDVSIPEARKALTDRLVAMGNAVDLLMENSWQPAGIEEVVKRALSHRARFGDRIRLAGPQVQIGSGASMSLSLALHELESNAIKYGALSNETGTVDVGWSVAQNNSACWLRFEWRELGGPLVSRPSTQGFGTKLISTAIGRRLSGATELDYRSEGFRWTLTGSADGLAS